MSHTTVNTTFCYNGAEFEFDIEDYECLERYEAAYKKMDVAEKAIKKDGERSAYVKAYCTMLREFFDDVLGAGAGAKVCGERMNTRTDTEAYGAFLEFVAAQSDAGIEAKNSIRQKFTGRGQRRAEAKVGK